MNLVKEEKIDHKFILFRISEYDIYRWELGEFTVGKPFCNPLRKDKTPSFTVFLGQDGKLHHKDFADERYKGDCFDIVQQKYGITLVQAFNKIAKDFMLVGGAPDAYKAITDQYIKPVISTKKHSLIQVTTKAFTKADLSYWNDYLIDKEDLKKEQIYSVKSLFLNRQKYPIDKDELVFAYYYDDGFKIYMPHREKGEKWLSNISTSKVENIEALRDNDRIIITKAKKDKICLSKIISGVVNVQNESRSCFTSEFIEQLKGKKVYVQYDSDVAGKKNSMVLTKELGYLHLNVPDHLLEEDIKDFSDWIKARGNTKEVEAFLKQKNII